jgi:hypothetical protein
VVERNLALGGEYDQCEPAVFGTASAKPRGPYHLSMLLLCLTAGQSSHRKRSACLRTPGSSCSNARIQVTVSSCNYNQVRNRSRVDLASRACGLLGSRVDWPLYCVHFSPESSRMPRVPGHKPHAKSTEIVMDSREEMEDGPDGATKIQRAV